MMLQNDGPNKDSQPSLKVLVLGLHFTDTLHSTDLADYLVTWGKRIQIQISGSKLFSDSYHCVLGIKYYLLIKSVTNRLT